MSVLSGEGIGSHDLPYRNTFFLLSCGLLILRT